MRDPLLEEREKTHGTFIRNAEIFNELLPVLWSRLITSCPRKRLALLMIMLKLARLISNPNNKDTWADISGYAKLGEEACDG